VAVIDTGIDFQHPDLNVNGNENCTIYGKIIVYQPALRYWFNLRSPKLLGIGGVFADAAF
jgi:hypothetical protein